MSLPQILDASVVLDSRTRRPLNLIYDVHGCFLNCDLLLPFLNNVNYVDNVNHVDNLNNVAHLCTL